MYVQWYSEHRPHETLRGKTPAEVRFGGKSALDAPVYEVRDRHPLPRGRPKGRAVRRAPKGVGLRVVDIECRRHSCAGDTAIGAASRSSSSAARRRVA